MVSADYLGSPIDCYITSDKTNFSQFNFQAYCWVNGGTKIPKTAYKFDPKNLIENGGCQRQMDSWYKVIIDLI